VTEQAQSTHPLTGELIFRWRVDTNHGLKITWKATADEARAAAEAKGHTVHSVLPSGGLLESVLVWRND
jgi:hypothetical protein